MIVVKGRANTWTVQFARKKGEQGIWKLEGSGGFHPKIVYRQEALVFPTGALQGGQAGAVDEAFNPIDVRSATYQFLDAEPEGGVLGWIVTGDRTWSAAPGAHSAVALCQLYAPELVENVVRRHESAGVMPQEIELDVEGLEMAKDKKGDPYLLWDRQAFPQLPVFEITVRMRASDYGSGWRFI